MADDPKTPVCSNKIADSHWTNAALLACRKPSCAVICPVCGAEAVRAEWNLIDLTNREADADLRCGSCSVAASVRIVLPPEAPAFHPFERMAPISDSLTQELTNLVKRVHERAMVLPAAAWMLDPLWLLAGWSATTFRWHPAGAAPPMMGLVFENAEPARQLFRNWTKRGGNLDELEEIRIAIIEGDIPGQDPGYSVHICPDPENFLVRATAEGIVIKDIPVTLFGQLRRMHPLPDTPPLLARFKKEFEKHQEFLLAPVTTREDRQRWVDVELGIVKHVVHFRCVADIGPGDLDEVVLRTPFTLPRCGSSVENSSDNTETQQRQ